MNPYGGLTAQTGTLTGTLAAGDVVDNAFHQSGGDYTGAVTHLRPSTAIPALSQRSRPALVAGLLGTGLSTWRRP